VFHNLERERVIAKDELEETRRKFNRIKNLYGKKLKQLNNVKILSEKTPSRIEPKRRPTPPPIQLKEPLPLPMWEELMLPSPPLLDEPAPEPPWEEFSLQS